MDDATQKLVDEARLTLPGDARMEAYYFGFERTGVAAVDAILSAVAVAGKGSHHTEGWSYESEHGYYSDRAGLPANPEGSAVSLIQAAASEAAGLVRSLADALEAAQRPPVSTEQREALDELIADVLIAERDEWPRDPGDAPSEVLAGAVTDALLARFSLPVLDVEKMCCSSSPTREVTMPDAYTDEAIYGRQDCDCDGSDDHPHTCDLHTITWDARKGA